MGFFCFDGAMRDNDSLKELNVTSLQKPDRKKKKQKKKLFKGAEYLVLQYLEMKAFFILQLVNQKRTQSRKPVNSNVRPCFLGCFSFLFLKQYWSWKPDDIILSIACCTVSSCLTGFNSKLDQYLHDYL